MRYYDHILSSAQGLTTKGGKLWQVKMNFIWRRLHSLLGVIPVGLFVVQHLIINHFATRGEEAFNNASNFMANLPFVIFLEFAVIYIPILFHGILGLYIAFTANNNPVRLGYFRNWMFTIQRITGILLLAFIAWHVWETRIQKAFFGAEVNFEMMANILSNPIVLILYIIGVLFSYIPSFKRFMVILG